MTGIYSVNVDYYHQKVTVWGICNKYDVLASVSIAIEKVFVFVTKTIIS